MRRSILSSAAIVVFAFASQCLAEDGQAPADQNKSLPVFRAKSNTIGINNLLRYDDNGGQIASAVYEDHTVGTLTLRVPMLIRADQRIESRFGGSNNPGSGSSLFLGDSAGDSTGIQLSGNKDMHFWMDNADNWGNLTPKMTLTRDGRLGIGTTAPGSTLQTGVEARLDVQAAADKNEFLVMQNTSNTANANGRIRVAADVANVDLVSHASVRTISRWGVTLGGWNEVVSSAGNGLAVGTYYDKPLILGTNTTARLTISGSTGAITIGSSTAPSDTTIYGTLTATKVIGAVYQDVAEWVPASTKMAPGTVVVLNRERRNEVMPSARAYDTAVAGVVSAQPGILLGVASDQKAQIATTGRVKVHVDAAPGPIAIGDLLVTSDKTGTAMKSQPVDIGGVQFHRPGTVIGKALEPLPDGQGDILVLLSLQ